VRVAVITGVVDVDELVDDEDVEFEVQGLQ